MWNVIQINKSLLKLRITWHNYSFDVRVLCKTLNLSIMLILEMPRDRGGGGNSKQSRDKCVSCWLTPTGSHHITCAKEVQKQVNSFTSLQPPTYRSLTFKHTSPVVSRNMENIFVDSSIRFDYKTNYSFHARHWLILAVKESTELAGCWTKNQLMENIKSISGLLLP